MSDEVQLDLFENHEQDGGEEIEPADEPKEAEYDSAKEQAEAREDANEKRVEEAIADPSNLQTPTELQGGAGETSLTGNSTPA